MRLSILAFLTLLATTPVFAAEPNGLALQDEINSSRLNLSNALERLITNKLNGAQATVIEADRQALRDAKTQMRISRQACMKLYTQAVAAASATNSGIEPVPCQ